MKIYSHRIINRSGLKHLRRLKMLVNSSNKAMQLDNLRAVQLCAARCAPFAAHNRSARELRLNRALGEKHVLRIYI